LSNGIAKEGNLQKTGSIVVIGTKIEQMVHSRRKSKAPGLPRFGTRSSANGEAGMKMSTEEEAGLMED
jgi:hypothetical protein